MSSLQKSHRQDVTSYQPTYNPRDIPENGSAGHRPRNSRRTSNETFHERPRSRARGPGNGRLSAKQSMDRMTTVQARDEVDNETIHSAVPSSVNNRSLSAVRNPIPAPTVTIRSEYPSLTHSRHPQSLTCLVTVEVPEGKWAPQPDDFAQPLPVNRGGSVRNTSIFSAPRLEKKAVEVFEDEEDLKYALEDLRNRLDNWHGLNFTR